MDKRAGFLSQYCPQMLSEGGDSIPNIVSWEPLLAELQDKLMFQPGKRND